MTDATVFGRLHGKAIQRTDSSGELFTTVTVDPVLDCRDEVSVIAFEAAVQKALLALSAGASVEITGTLVPSFSAAAGDGDVFGWHVVARVVTSNQATHRRFATGGKKGFA